MIETDIEANKLKHIEYWNSFIASEKIGYHYLSKNSIIESYIKCAIGTNNSVLFDLIFDYLGVPDTLSFKEKLCYYQLTIESN